MNHTRAGASATLNANVGEKIADNGSMTTDMFAGERTITAEREPAEIAATSYIWIEDTLKEAPNELLSGDVDSSSEQEEESIADEPVFSGPTAVAICSQTNGRTNNEDSYFVQALPTGANAPVTLLLSLSDGMGGHDFGEHASRETLRKLALLLFEQYAVTPYLNAGGAALTVEDVGKTMAQIVPLVSAHVQRIAEINGWNRSGATLVAGAVVGDTAVFINVGDSPAYHVRPTRKQVRVMTDDHSLAGMLLKANLISADMARVHEGRSQLEHYIGGPNLPNEMPIRSVRLLPGDYLLLCSDGVSNSLTESVILRLIEEGKESLSDCAAGFVVHARQEGEQDNQTVVLYRHGTTDGRIETVVIPDTGPNSPHPADFPDNMPKSAEPEETAEAVA